MANHDTARTVFITGTSTGIGRTTALQLDASGWRVFAGVRREQDGESLRAKSSQRLTPVLVDVTDAAAVAQAAKNVKDERFEQFGRRASPPEAVARAIERALTRPRARTRTSVGVDAKLSLFLNRILPDRARDALLGRLVGL